VLTLTLLLLLHCNQIYFTMYTNTGINTREYYATTATGNLNTQHQP
jgi:hypothetical protein